MKPILYTCLTVLLLIPVYTQSQTPDQNDYSEYILTPTPPVSPRINGPKVYGLRPGSPFLYKIPCTGERPIRFSINTLPDGLSLDPDRGIITGSISNKGSYTFELCAQNNKGDHCRELKIIVGDKLALTPPMGWNSWYIHYDRISDKLMREAADQMINSGMADYGYNM